MKQIVAKAAVKTVIFLLALLAIATAVVNFFFPQHMATLFERVGNYSLAVKYSSQRYDATGEISDLARTYQNAVLYGKSELIIEYGEELINFEGFEELCALKDEESLNNSFGKYTTSYKNYVCGNLSVAYAMQNNFEKAIQTAKNSNGNQSFARGNAYVSLTLYAAENNLSDLARKIQTELLIISQNLDTDSQDISILNDMLEILSAV